MMLAVTPLVVVYLFSVAFINRGIDNWFSLDVERGLGDALALSQTALDMQKRETLDEIQRVAVELSVADDSALIGDLAASRRTTGAIEMTLYDSANRIRCDQLGNNRRTATTIPNRRSYFSFATKWWLCRT